MGKKLRLKTYLPFALNAFQRMLSYKASVIIFLIGEGMMLVVTYYLWKAIYGNSPDMIINSFTLNEMIIYILVSFLTTLMTSADIVYDISREVKDGTIAINLIRPVSFEKRMMFQCLGMLLYYFVVVFIAAFTIINILLYSYQGSISITNILLYLLSTILGALVNFYFSYAFGLLSFKITNMWGLSFIMMAIVQLLSGALIPIAFFPSIIQRFIELLPFSSLIYTPTMIFLGKITGIELVKALSLQIIWIIILAAVAKLMWNALVKRLTILGG